MIKKVMDERNVVAWVRSKYHSCLVKLIDNLIQLEKNICLKIIFYTYYYENLVLIERMRESFGHIGGTNYM